MEKQNDCAARLAHVKMGSVPVRFSPPLLAKLHWGVRSVLLLGATYALLVAMIAFFQRSLIYHPMTASPQQLQALANASDMAPWGDDPAEPVRGWFVRSGRPGVGLVMLHGNAGFALHRAPLLHRLRQAAGIGPALVLEYPGYGGRSGTTPCEAVIMAEARQAIAAWAEKTGGPVLVVGESLGSAFAAQVAAECPELVRGLLLITPMNRLRDVAAHHFPFFPVSWMLRERMDAEAALTGCRIPLALVIAEHDEVIPPRLGLRLLEVTQGPARAWTVPGAFHNTLPIGPGQGPWDEALAFLLDEPPLP